MLIQEDVQGVAAWKNSKLKRQPRNAMKNFGKKTSEDCKERLSSCKSRFSGDRCSTRFRAADAGGIVLHKCFSISAAEIAA